MLPDMNLMTDLDLGGKIVQETGVSFNIIILEMVTIKGQSKKNMTSFWHNMHPGRFNPYETICNFIQFAFVSPFVQPQVLATLAT